MTTDARAAVSAFFRSVTIESPEWTARAGALVRKGDQAMIRLLSRYLPVLPPGLRAAVLDAMSVKPHREAVLAAKSAGTLKSDSRVGPKPR